MFILLEREAGGRSDHRTWKKSSGTGRCVHLCGITGESGTFGL